MVLLKRVEDCGLHASQMIQRERVEEIRSNDEVAENRVDRWRIDGELKGEFGDLFQNERNVFGGERRRKHGGKLDESVLVDEFGDRGVKLLDQIVADPNGIEFDERMRISLFLEIRRRRIDLVVMNPFHSDSVLVQLLLRNVLVRAEEAQQRVGLANQSRFSIETFWLSNLWGMNDPVLMLPRTSPRFKSCSIDSWRNVFSNEYLRCSSTFPRTAR